MNKIMSEELQKWLSPSPLLTFAKALRMQGGAVPDSAASNDLLKHFEGIDLDELPDSVREKVTAAREGIVTLQKTVTDANTRAEKAQEFGRNQQARADKLDTVVRRHNLDPNASASNTNPPNTADARILARAARFEAQGIKPDVALAHAKLFEVEYQENQKEFDSKLAQVAGGVGNVQSDQAVSDFETANSDAFRIPEIKQEIYTAVKQLKDNGRVVNAETLNHLLNMAYGKLARTNPDALKKEKVEDAVPRFGKGGGMSGGGTVVTSQNGNNNGAPVARDPQTTDIMSKITGFMTAGMPAKKK